MPVESGLTDGCYPGEKSRPYMLKPHDSSFRTKSEKSMRSNQSLKVNFISSSVEKKMRLHHHFRFTRVATGLVVGAILAVSSAAQANPRPFPFTYIVPTEPQGDLELELYADMLPVKVLDAEEKKPTKLLLPQYQIEMEYGITHKLELGLYLTLAPRPGESYSSVPSLTEGNGLKQRLKYRFDDPGEWPIDVAVYGELTEREKEIEIEAKLILERRFGDFRIATNLVLEREYEFAGEAAWVLNPSLGLTYQITPRFHPGIESFVRYELPDEAEPGPKPFEDRPQAYVGPTMLFSFGDIWWSSGMYFRATDQHHTMQVGESLAPIWFRSVVGVGL